MKLRRDKIEVTDDAEREAVGAVRRLATEDDYQESIARQPSYFVNLTVKTNERIDHVTSGKALSISWLARVAVPGVVAILFFFIGLHYYVPDLASEKHSIAESVKALPPEDIDLLLAASSSETALTAAELHIDLFKVSNDQLADFYVASENPTIVLESLPEHQLDEVAAILESRSTNL